jgi:polysaccharide deacetylase family protein (PEP-CTERM system associated)
VSSKQLRNAFSVDVEDYYQVSAFEGQVSREEWPRFSSRVVPNTYRLLEILDEHQTRATFFVLGWVAERFPRMVRDIQRAGHEIGSHSYWHHLVYRQTPDDFRADLLRSKHVLEDIVGEPIVAYRAPSFSIVKSSLWALNILAEEGFRVDSSVFPIRHDRYGMPDSPVSLHQRSTPHGPIWEFPMSVLRVSGVNLPISGGGYFRLYPAAVSISSLRLANQRTGQPCMFYIHPWEIDPEQPHVLAGSWLSRRRHRLNLHSTERKLHALLSACPFTAVGDVLPASADWDNDPHHANPVPTFN